MDKDDWGIEIKHAHAGFVITDNEGEIFPMQQKPDESDAAFYVRILWFVITFFNMRPSGYEKEVVTAHTESGRKYSPREGEKIVRDYYSIVAEAGPAEELEQNGC